MNKRFSVLLLILALAFCLASPALADSELSNVTDAAALLSKQEWGTLETRAEQISESYGCGVYIVTVDDYTDYTYGGVEDCAEIIYKEYSMGVGPEQNGIMLLLSMADRDYDLCAYGETGHYSFTDYGKELLADEFLDNFRNNDWYGGFADYLETCDRYLAAAQQGQPVDYVQPTVLERMSEYFMPALLLGIIVAFIYCGVLKKQMKSAVQAVEASRYVVKNGIRMDAEQDVFTHSTVVRQRIERSSGGGGGGGHGGTHINSGGFSHSSGKF